MITLKVTGKDGDVREMSFNDKREAASLLRELFGDECFVTEKQRISNEISEGMREMCRRQRVDPEAYFREFRRRSEANK